MVERVPDKNEVEGSIPSTPTLRQAQCKPMQKEVFFGEQKIVYFEKGKGFPFLIIHGWGGSTSPLYNLKFQAALAKKGFRVFVIALPGFGESSLPNLKNDNDAITESVLKFADRLKLKHFFVYGHCLGGLIAIKIGKLYPKRVKGVILCAAPSPFMVKTLMRVGYLGLILFLLIAELSQLFLPPVYFFRRLRRWLHQQFKFYRRKKGVMWRAWKRIMKKDFQEVFTHIETIKKPVLIIAGTKENLLIKSGLGFFKKIPNSISRLIPEANHSVQIDAPEQLAEEIANFIKRLDKSVKRDYNHKS